jgi:FixJ family two-component response regulator
MPNRPVRVAIVDDDRSVRTALARLLAARSFLPATFASGSEFLDSLRTGAPDCLILDLQMPGMTGIEVQRCLRRMDIRLPTIVITAHDEVGLQERSRAAGAFAVLFKPLDASGLVAAIDAAIAEASAS